MAKRRVITSDVGGTDLSVIVTPMLDMAFQLLAFFIMTYHPPAREAIVDDTLLPVAEVKGKSTSSPGDKVEKKEEKKKDPEDKLSLKVLLVAARKGDRLAPGQLKTIKVYRPGVDLFPSSPGKEYECKEKGPTASDPPADFEPKLKELVEFLKKNQEPPLAILADRMLKYSYVARVRDVVGTPPLNFKSIGLTVWVVGG
jgi:biopolymer transport protein ExbD